MPKSSRQGELGSRVAPQDWRRVRRFLWTVNNIGVLSWAPNHVGIDQADEDIRTAFQEAIFGQDISLPSGIQVDVKVVLSRTRYSLDELLSFCEVVVDDAKLSFTTLDVFSRVYPSSFPGRVFRTIEFCLEASSKSFPEEKAGQDHLDVINKIDSHLDRPIKAAVQKNVVVVSEDSKDSVGANRQRLVAELFDGLPDDPESRIAAVVAMQHLFRERAIYVLQNVIKELLKNPPLTLSEKQSLASKLNHDFQDLGIAVSTEDLPEPCSIVANRSQSAEAGYLRLQTRKGPRRQSKSSENLASIDVITAVETPHSARER